MARGLRIGLVTAAAISSLGFVAVENATHSAPPVSAATSQTSPAAAHQRVSLGPGNGNAPHAVTGGSIVTSQPGTASNGTTSLRPGSGTVHAVSHGS